MLTVTAALLLGTAATLAVLWDRPQDAAGSGDTSSVQPSGWPATPAAVDRAQDPKPQDPRRGPPRVVRVAEEPILEDVEVKLHGAKATLEIANYILIVDLPPSDKSVADQGYRAKVIAVLKGEGIEVGQFVELCMKSPQRKAGEQLLFDTVPLGLPTARSNGRFLLALDDAEGISRIDVPRLQHATGSSMFGLPLKARHTPSTKKDSLGRLRDEIASGLSAADPFVRRSAVSALRRWDGMTQITDEVAVGSPWQPGPLADTLLAMVDDPDEGVRKTLAVSIPAALGKAAEQAYERLCFDPCMAVRIAASRSLKKFAPRPWLAQLESGDSWWRALTTESGTARWLGAAIESAAKEGITERVAAFERQFGKERHENHLLGAIGLGTTGESRALGRLRALAEHQDARVRAAAAHSRVKVGDRTGYDELRKLVSGDAEAAVYAIQMLAGLRTRESLDLLVEAAKSEHELVRALVAGALRVHRSREPHVVDAILGDLRKDASAMVQAAAQ